MYTHFPKNIYIYTRQQLPKKKTHRHTLCARIETVTQYHQKKKCYFELFFWLKIVTLSLKSYQEEKKKWAEDVESEAYIPPLQLGSVFFIIIFIFWLFYFQFVHWKILKIQKFYVGSRSVRVVLHSAQETKGIFF